MRKDHYILWRDTRLKEPYVFTLKKIELEYMKESSREVEINVYIKNNSTDALNIIKNKIYSHVKLITNGGDNADGQYLIDDAREIIGKNFVCFVFANNVGHLEWISKRKNVFYTSIPYLFKQFVKCNMITNDIIAFVDTQLQKQESIEVYKKNNDNKVPWEKDESELLNFPERKQPIPTLPLAPHLQPPPQSQSICNLA